MSVPETPYTRGEMYLSAIADGDSGGIPERPYTRKEMYLDAIARGDSSGIPERPYTREEMYLDEIARNGGGGGGGGGSSSLSRLTDVDISNPTDGQTLVYNATSGKWENGESGGSGGAMLVLHGTGQSGALDKTAKEILDAINAGKIIVQEVVTAIGMEHTYAQLVAYYASADEGYEFNFVRFNPSGDVLYATFVTDTENGYPVLSS